MEHNCTVHPTLIPRPPLTSKHSTQPKDHLLAAAAAETAGVAAVAAVPNLVGPAVPAALIQAFQCPGYPFPHSTRFRRNAPSAAVQAVEGPEAAEVEQNLEGRTLLAAIAAVVEVARPGGSVPRGCRTSSGCKGETGQRRFVLAAERRGGGRDRC